MVFCRDCGAKINDNAIVCTNCGVAIIHRFPQHIFAGFWKRAGAVIIDGIILSLISAIPTSLILFIIAASNPYINGDELFDIFDIIFQIFSLIFGWLYSAFFHSSIYQATPGKLALGIVVTDLDGNRISFGRATGRYFASIISGCICYVGYMMAGWTEKKQALHDMIAGTLVKNK